MYSYLQHSSNMKSYSCFNILKSSWDHVSSAFWQRYPNPYSKHVLSEDVLEREVTTDCKLRTRRLLSKTSRLPRWAERFFPGGSLRPAYIVEDSVVDPHRRTLMTHTWNVNHVRLMVVEEKCEYMVHPDNCAWTLVYRQAWISSNIFGFSRAIQEFGLARFKSNVTKTVKGFEYILSSLHGEFGVMLRIFYADRLMLQTSACESTSRK
uniref:PRELI domain containing 1a n=1 Tax=Eptatretus burgeri TaxID=7764 RepID=A0A8C4QI15_EPTBU